MLSRTIVTFATLWSLSSTIVDVLALPQPQYDGYGSNTQVLSTSLSGDDGGYSSSDSWTYSSDPYGYTATGSGDSATSTTVVGTSTTATGTAPSSTSTSIASQVHVVQVGKDGLTYTPNFINAAIGDQVTFIFNPKNHTVTQSAFATPCSPLTAADGVTPIGLDSGFIPVLPGSATQPSWTLNVNVSTPLWFYCRQANHCPSGMVFGINPPTTGNTIDAFIAKAKASTPTTTSMASAKWSGSGIVAASSTGVAGTSSIDPSLLNAASLSSATGTSTGPGSTTTTKAGSAATLGGGKGLAGVVVGLIFSWLLM
ncbi:hypothetical protein T439DRAFT_383827 [Meredithblackwellia eburnea MCA 4105]